MGQSVDCSYDEGISYYAITTRPIFRSRVLLFLFAIKSGARCSAGFLTGLGPQWVIFQLTGFKNVIVLDMGGTSADISATKARPR
jgi:hypothetical protein